MRLQNWRTMTIDQITTDTFDDDDKLADLDDVVAHAPTEEDVRAQPAVVTTCQLLQLPALSVAHHVEL